MISTVDNAPEGDPNDKNKPSASEQATASSAHSRINIPLNLENWKDLPEDIQTDLLWFHQHALDAKLQWTDCCSALNYDRSTIFKILKGTYEGSWKNICKAIQSYRSIVETRGTIQQNEFAENSISKLIFAGLRYAMANNSMTMIIGESRMGKSIAAREWRDRNNHGRSVFVTAPPYGGTKAFLQDIARVVGVSANLPVPQMLAAIYRAFNRNRILIVDEAHRLLPSERRSNPVNLEIVRDIHDKTGCAVALIATARFDASLRASEYMFEQVLGRIGMPIRLPKKIKEEDLLPILRQYIPKPSATLLADALRIANELGRLGILVETLKVASRMAAKEKKPLTESHVFGAIKFRKEMSQPQ